MKCIILPAFPCSEVHQYPVCDSGLHLLEHLQYVMQIFMQKETV